MYRWLFKPRRLTTNRGEGLHKALPTRSGTVGQLSLKNNQGEPCLAQPYDEAGVSPGVPTRALGHQKTRTLRQQTLTFTLGLGIGLAVMAPHAQAQTASPLLADQEQRRAQDREQERERALRQQPTRQPNVPPTTPTPTPAPADRLPSEDPCFVIQQLDLQVHASAGVARPSPDPWRWLLAAAAGPLQDDSPVHRCMGPKSIELILARLQNALIQQGWVTTRVLAGAQDLSRGVLTLTVVPGRIGAIALTEPVDLRARIINAMPAKAGDLLNLRDIEQALENFKRVPTAQADIAITPAEGAEGQPAQLGESDLRISYKQGFPFRVALSADDSGSKATGKYQGSASINYDNFLTLNDLLYITLSHDLGGGQGAGRQAQGTRGKSVHYSMPWGYWLVGASVNTSRYFQSVAGLNQNYVYSGTSSMSEISLARVVQRDTSGKTTLSLKAFQRQSNNFIDDTEVQVQRRRVGGWQVGAAHQQAIGPAKLDLSLAYKRGTGAFGSQAAPEQAFGEGTARFALTSFEAALSWPFALGAQSVRYNAVGRGQTNHTPLTAQDRFAIGGRFSVRGFDGESSLSAERGWLMRHELSASLGASGQWAYVGLDHGEVSGPSSDFLVGTRLTGAVLGLRGSVNAFQYDAFVGAPVRKPAYFRTAPVTAGISLSLAF